MAVVFLAILQICSVLARVTQTPTITSAQAV